MDALRKPIILILCTGNSCRSHMAEGILREVAGDMLEVQSAGSDPAGYVHPLAIRALGEIGRTGVAIDTLHDMRDLFEGIDLEKISVSMTINRPAFVLVDNILPQQKTGVPP